MTQSRHEQVVQRQFGAQANAYLTSAVHAQGEEFAQLRERLSALPVQLRVGTGPPAWRPYARRVDAAEVAALGVQLEPYINSVHATAVLRSLLAHFGIEVTDSKDAPVFRPPQANQGGG